MTERPSGGRATDKNEIKPFHAKDVTTGQETADVVKAVLEHAAARDAAAKQKMPPKPQPIWMLPLGLTLAVLATFLLVAPPPWIIVNPIAAQTPEDAIASTQRAVWAYANKIEGYRVTNGRLPQTLAEANISVAGLEYRVIGEGYLLATTVGEEEVFFNSSVESLPQWTARMGLNFDIGG